MEIIERPVYLRRIQPFINKQLIKVLTGQRRVGKSFMLKQIQNYIQQINPEANCIFIDKELHKFNKIQNCDDLIQYIDTVAKPSSNYLFIDEIQEIAEFEKAVRSLLNQGNFDIYCTGSNASVLSGEIATMLSGRQIIIRIHSLSYQEYLTFHNKKNTRENLLNYLKVGGLPYLMHLPDEEYIVADYLKNIYTTILYRDIVSRHNIRDVKFLENLVRFLASNTGSLFSAKNISDYLKSQKISKSVPVVIDYIKYLSDAFFVNLVQRSDIQGKKIFDVGEKIYFSDLGIRNALSGFNQGDIHKNIENAVCNHLLQNGWDIFVGKSDNKEIDFIAKKNNETAYFQVTYQLNDYSTIEREFGNLLEIKDNYPKYVISLDTFKTPNTYLGIKHIQLQDFLTGFE